MIKICCWIFIILLSSFAKAQQYNCKGLDLEYEKIVQQIGKKCDHKNQCHIDVLNWSAYGAPTAHSDQEMAAELIKNRSEIHKICKYIVAPCPAIPSEAHCVAQTCFTQEEVLEKDYEITIKFFLNNNPLLKSQITIDYDNGIRCASAPCPSRTVFRHLETDENGKVKISLNELIKKSSINLKSDTPSLSNSEMNLSQLAFVFQNKYFSNFNLYDFLSKQKPPFVHEVRWIMGK